MSDSRSSAVARASAPLRLLAAMAGLGGLAGLCIGLLAVMRHGYWDLGFSRNAFLLLRESILAGTAVGTLAGVSLEILGSLTRRLAKRLESTLGQWADSPLLSYLAALIAALVTLALMPVVRGFVSPARLGVVVVVTGLYAVGLALSRRLGWEWLGRLAHLGLAMTLLSILLVDRSLIGRALRPEGLIVLAAVLLAGALCVTRWGPSHGAIRALSWLLILSLAVPALVVAGGARFGQPGLESSNPRNVLLIAVDTYRWDHSPAAGVAAIDAEVAPNLARLAARGTVFSSAISQAPWTLPAFASVMTGKYPRQHGAYSIFSILEDREMTLAEVLREAGYRTGGAVSHMFVDRDHGFAQGFDWFDDDNSMGEWEITSQGVSDEAIRFLDETGDERFFLFAHYFDPHHHYRDHAEWEWANGYDGWLSRQPMGIWTLRRYRHAMDSEDVGYLRDLYREEVAYTDREIGRLLEDLETRGLADDTMILLVVDHGEEFMERGWIGHTVTLFDELIRVPMLVVLPGEDAGRSRVPETVETRALFSTVADYLGVDFARDELGASLLPLMEGSPPDGWSPAFSEVWVPEAAVDTGKREMLAAVRTDDWKLVLDLDRGRESVFDLAADPDELENQAGLAPEPTRELRALLDSWLEQMAEESSGAGARAVDPETLQKLEALGYL